MNNIIEQIQIKNTYPILYHTGVILEILKNPCVVAFIIFFILKIIDKIDWSWWFVTMPLYAWLPIILMAFLGELIRYKIKNNKKVVK